MLFSVQNRKAATIIVSLLVSHLQQVALGQVERGSAGASKAVLRCLDGSELESVYAEFNNQSMTSESKSRVCSHYCARRYSKAPLEATYSSEQQSSALCCCSSDESKLGREEVGGIQLRSLERIPAHSRSSEQQVSHSLEPPFLLGQEKPFQGPGVDLVALNRNRFESEHRHKNSANGEDELRRSELIESKLAAIPENLLNNLPEGLNKQLLDSLSTDPSLMVGPATMLFPDGDSADDPDGASVERLTKSCLTVHASSSRPEQLNVTFHLYTKSNPSAPFILKPQVSRLELLRNSPFRAERAIKWITHGFHTNVDKSEWMLEAKDKILAFEDANVILTDWRRGASPTLAFYPKAAANAHVVAKLIVNILRRLRNDIDFSKVHLIGHSLGAHIMGFVGSAFTEEYLYQQQQALMMRSSLPEPSLASGAAGQLIGRITACDPALPCFGPTSSSPASPAPSSTPPSAEPKANEAAPALDWTPSMWTHLRPDSAVVVEVMHSNPGVMGYSEVLGDFDFFPNGFEKQPGCGVPQNQSPPPTQDRRAVGVAGRARRQLGSLVGNIWGTLANSQRNSPERDAHSSPGNPLNRIIKPIRDFFHGYTCSHHRSVEYMVESMYYDRVPQDRKLDRDFVCQMVGYRCRDYQSFKRGFCYKCATEQDCRAFTMSSPLLAASPTTSETLVQQARSFGRPSSKRSISLAAAKHMEKFKLAPLEPAASHNRSSPGKLPSRESELESHSSSSSGRLERLASQVLNKRVLPTFNHLNQHYLPPGRNQYFFDTKPSKDFCLHHYHLLVKYRWFRVRDSVQVRGIRLVGTLANITVGGYGGLSAGADSQRSPGILLNRHSLQTYTMLVTEPTFLGQVEALVIMGDRLRSSLVEFVEVTYMSNLDARIRALGSARLCRSPAEAAPKQPKPPVSSYSDNKFLPPEEELQLEGAGGSEGPPQDKLGEESLFVRCSGSLV